MSIVEISRQDLKPGYVGELFRRGNAAVILKNDPRISTVWNGILKSKNGDDKNEFCHEHPWNSSILEIARNHLHHNMDFGEMLRYQPDVYNHFARKTKTYPIPEEDRMEAYPKYLANGQEAVKYTEKTLRTAWDLMSDVLESSLPRRDAEFPQYAISVEVLKYPNSLSDLAKIYSLLGDISGGWTRVGHQLDRFKGDAAQLFKVRGIQDLFAISCLLPGIGNVARGLNRILKKYGYDKIPHNTQVLGNAHVDGSKFITCLASDRDVIRTQYFEGNAWKELPLSRDTLAIFPSKKFSDLFSMSATLHRVLMDETSNSEEHCAPNITLGLAVIER